LAFLQSAEDYLEKLETTKRLSTAFFQQITKGGDFASFSTCGILAPHLEPLFPLGRAISETLSEFRYDGGSKTKLQRKLGTFSSINNNGKLDFYKQQNHTERGAKRL